MPAPRAVATRLLRFSILAIVVASPAVDVAAVTVRILTPAHSSLVADQVVVVADVASQFEVKSAVAQVANRSVSLVFNSCAIGQGNTCQPGWKGTLDLTGLPRGPYDLTVTATEALGASGVDSRPLVLDRGPLVTVTRPMNKAVARPAMHVTAACTDDDRCVLLQVITQGGDVLATQVNGIDQDLSLAPYDGTAQRLLIQGTDTAGQKHTVFVDVFVDGTPRLAEVTTVTGRILDFDGTRILFAETVDESERVVLRDRATGRDTVVATYVGGAFDARLTAPGVLATGKIAGPSNNQVLEEWRAGVLTRLWADGSFVFGHLEVAGDYAIVTGTPPQRYRLNDRILEPLAMGFAVSADIGSNGNGALAPCCTGGGVYRSEGTTTSLIDGARSVDIPSPVTDGTSIVFLRENPNEIVLWRDGIKQTLATNLPSSVRNDARYRWYQIENGFTAFVRGGTTGQSQVWLRSTDGMEEQLSFFLQSSFVDHLAPTGDLTYTSSGRTYLVEGANAHVDIASALGRSYFRDGLWYVVIGNTLFAVVTPGTTDADADGLPDAWERQFGLDIALADAGGDPDGDGLTNLQELQRGTHPRGFVTRYFAEGATSAFFDAQFALLNTSASGEAEVLLRYLKGDGSTASSVVIVPPLVRRTVTAKDHPGLATAEFSTVVESDELVVVDRTMTWDVRGYGAHAETGILTAATTWFLAEGATHSGFNLFYLVQNPHDQPAQVAVTYLLPSGAPLQKTYTVPASSRFNIWVNDEAKTFPVLAATDVSARLVGDRPIIVERAMYLNSGGLLFGAGHVSAGVTAPGLTWFLAEGNTGPYFDEFVLIANPNATASTMTVRFLLGTGAVVTRGYIVAPNSRFTIWVDQVDAQFADAAVSTTVTVTNDVPVIVERAMWWPGPTAATWHEAHNSPGVTQTGTKWVLAEGAQGGARSVQTYILVANTSDTAGSVKVTLLFEDGTHTERTFPIAPTSRFNVDVAAYFPEAGGRTFGAIVESLGSTPAPIVVERAMYSNTDGVVWAAGTNAVATKLQ